MTSFRVIRENANLLIFPVLSTAALIVVCLTFMGGFLALFGLGVNFESFLESTFVNSEIGIYMALFAFYLICYFVIVFFNVALVHCARRILNGEEATVRDGLSFSGRRLGTIFSWSVLSATVGVVLQIIEDRLGWIGSIVASIIGVVWSIATFFAIPVIAYEDLGPIEAVKRSANIMKEKWGEAIGANFSFSVFFILGYLVIALGGVLLFNIHPVLAVVSIVLSILLLHTAVSAAKMVFLAATYQHVKEEPIEYFDSDILDSAFRPKKK